MKKVVFVVVVIMLVLIIKDLITINAEVNRMTIEEKRINAQVEKCFYDTQAEDLICD